jgi:hypothetical protein
MKGDIQAELNKNTLSTDDGRLSMENTATESSSTQKSIKQTGHDMFMKKQKDIVKRLKKIKEKKQIRQNFPIARVRKIMNTDPDVKVI